MPRLLRRRHRFDISETLEKTLPTRKHRRRLLPRRNLDRKPLARPKVVLRLASSVPSFLTLCNGWCGLVSIAIATNSLFDLRPSTAAYLAALFIFAGMFFDVVDGFVARRMKHTSEFGGQLDSLCDAITFGAAPLFIMLCIDHPLSRGVMFIVGSCFCLSVLIRLARFNVETGPEDPHDAFTGLPSPAGAGTIAAFALTLVALDRQRLPAMQLMDSASIVFDSIIHFGLPLLALVIAALMMSRFRYSRPQLPSVKHRAGKLQCVAVASLLSLSVVALREMTVLIGFCLFAAKGPSIALAQRYHQRHQQKLYPQSTPVLTAAKTTNIQPSLASYPSENKN